MDGHDGTCNNADRCAGYDPQLKLGAHTSRPLCGDCLDQAARNIRSLVFDYLDLAQLHEPTLSQAIAERASGSKERPIPISQHVEALQAEIVHVTTTWEYELRVACRLSDPGTVRPSWRVTTSNYEPALKTRPGTAVQRAVEVIGSRLERLSQLPATVVCPTGVDDEPADMYGWQAVQQLTDLHGRARGMLGRTTRRFWIPGECWACPSRPVRGVDGPLYRSEPKFEGDPMQVNCDKCSAYRAYPDYETYMATLLWPELEVAA
uniref:hypothetical protein n=1 Tax=Paractinoplanes polyasparticus TaxID=2856853 RepID=UPI001C854D1F|nr:hypothetical protein [Actinoplanes polyasparticus]